MVHVVPKDRKNDTRTSDSRRTCNYKKIQYILLLCIYFARIKPAVKTNLIAWDNTNAAGMPLISAQTPTRTKMDHNQRAV
jgi:hypothetical protein